MVSQMNHFANECYLYVPQRTEDHRAIDFTAAVIKKKREGKKKKILFVLLCSMSKCELSGTWMR